MNERLIGENIRRLRRAKGYALTEVALRAGLTKSSLSKIETGQVSASISTFLKIAEATGSELADFFRKSESPPSYVLTRKGEGDTLVTGGTKFGYSYEALATKMPCKGAEPFLLTIKPGDRKGSFAHGGQEFIYMLSGRLDFTVGTDSMRLGPGDSLYFDPTLTHTTCVVGKETARFLCLFIRDNIQQSPTGVAA